MDHQNEGLGVKRVKLEETNNSIFPKETQHVLTISCKHETRTCLGFFMVMICLEIKQCTIKFFTTSMYNTAEWESGWRVNLSFQCVSNLCFTLSHVLCPKFSSCNPKEKAILYTYECRKIEQTDHLFCCDGPIKEAY